MYWYCKEKFCLGHLWEWKGKITLYSIGDQDSEALIFKLDDVWFLNISMKETDEIMDKISSLIVTWVIVLSYCPQAQWIESLQIHPKDYLTRQLLYPIGEELFNMKKEGIRKKLFWYVRLNFVVITWLKTKLTTKSNCSSLFVECWMSCKPQLLQSLLNSRLSHFKGGYPPDKSPSSG